MDGIPESLPAQLERLMGALCISAVFATDGLPIDQVFCWLSVESQDRCNVRCRAGSCSFLRPLPSWGW